jgi:enamine deaminase RidA (YjgF/YER057c/UK114 family)
MTYEEKLAQLGYSIEPVKLEAGKLVQAVQTGNLVFTSGQVPIRGNSSIKGKVGDDVSVEEAREAARICAVNALRAIKTLVGTLETIRRIVKVFGMVNVALGFQETPAVIDGCSELLIDVFGESGKHARSAVGMSLPLNYAVEIEIVVEVTSLPPP